MKCSSLLAVVLALVLVQRSGGQSKEEPKLDPAATRDYAVAVGLQSKKLYGQAAQRWQKFIQAFPKDPRLANGWHQLGVCQVQEKKYAEAAKAFRTLLDKHPKYEALDAAQFNLGLSLYNLGLESKKPEDLRAAGKEFSAVPAKFPKSQYAPTALYYEGECLYQAGDVKAAAAAYRKAVEAFPKHASPELYYALGTAQQDCEEHQGAAVTFQTFLQKFPKHELANECRLRQAQSLFKQKQFKEAEPLFGQTASAAAFALADFALVQQGHCWFEQGDFAKAAALFATLPKQFPKSAYREKALLAEGKAWFQAGKHAEAQTALSAVLDAKGSDAPVAAYWLGQALLKLNQAAKAAAVMEKALADFPASPLVPQLAFARIDALYEQPEKRKQAVLLYVDFAKKHPEHELAPRALYLASLAALRVSDYAAAQSHAQQFLDNAKFAAHELAPEVLYVGAESHLQAVKPDLAKAETLFRKLIKEHPQHGQAAQARVRIGLCLLLAKKHEESVAALQEALPHLKDPAQLAEAQLLLGRNWHEAGKTAEAIAAFEKALAAQPKAEQSAEALFYLAHGLRGAKRTKEAADRLKQLLQNHPKSGYLPQSLYALADLAFAEKQFDEALTRYDQLAKQFPKHELAPLAQFGIGLAHLGKQADARAVAALTVVLDQHPKLEVAKRARYLRGLAHQRLEQHASAVKDLSAFLEDNPDPKEAVDARFTLALCQAGLKQFDEAAATLEQLLKAHPDYPQADKAYYEWAFALLQGKKEKEASAVFRQLATKLPDSPLAAESWFRVGAFHADNKQLDEAASALDSGLQKAKAAELRERLQYKLGWVHYQRGKWSDAAALLQAQIKEHPKGELTPHAVYLAGESLFQHGQFKEALPLFEQTVQAKVKDYYARALYRSGACLANLKQWAASQKQYSALISQFPKFELLPEVRYGLGWALQNQGKLDEARAVYEQVAGAKEPEVAGSETAAKSRFMIGECAFAQKKYKEAIEHFFTAALGYAYPEWQALAYFEAGRCFIELKDRPRALECLETVTQKFPKHPRAKDAQSLIERLKKEK